MKEELKKQFGSKYANRRELRRQLAQYQKTSIEDLSSMVQLQKGGSVSEAVRKMTEQRRIRLFRKVRRDINDMMKAERREIFFHSQMMRFQDLKILRVNLQKARWYQNQELE